MRRPFKHSIRTIKDKTLAIIRLPLSNADATDSENKNNSMDAIALVSKTIKKME